MTYLKLFTCLTLLCGTLACSKKDTTTVPTDGNGQSAQPVQRPVGKITGPATVKTIGPAGGQLTTPDNHIRLEVPPGAVAGNIQFSIQPVENTLEGSPGRAFRLLPEDVQFSKPVTIRYNVGPTELANTIPGSLFLAYQDKKGHHYMATDTDFDPATNQLSVQTTHFSDWTIAELLELVSDTTQVPLGGKANLRLMWHMGSLLEPLTPNQPIGGLTDYNGYVSQLKWSLAAGKGSIQAKGIQCTYQAPDQLPQENPAYVSVSVPVSSYGSKRKGLIMLTTSIFTIPDEYITVFVDGQPTTNQPPENGNTYINLGSNNFHLSAFLQNNYHISILIPGDIITGSFTYGDDFHKSYIDYANNDNGDEAWKTDKSDCEFCDMVYSGGSVKIKKAGGIGDYVEGEFTAEVWLMGQYAPPKKNLSGKFRVKRYY